MLYEQICSAKKELERKVKSLEFQISKLPDGKLLCTNNSGYWKWFQSDGHKHTYIPKKNRKLAEELARKKFLSLQLKNALHEKTALDFYLRHHDTNAVQAEQNFLSSPQYNELLANSFKPLSKELAKWQSAPYQRNTHFPEDLTFKAASGNMVRSKSEALIDLYLFKNKIPFRYENLLNLGGKLIFPDFTIRHPKTGQFFYWEHFGLMDNSDYAKKAGQKLQLYVSNGIIPNVQLIITFETKNTPLTPDIIENILAQHFLPSEEIF